jgi:cell division protein DivIC
MGQNFSGDIFTQLPMVKSKRSSRLLWLIVLSLCSFFAVIYGTRLATTVYTARLIDQQAVRVAEEQQRQQVLQQQLAYVRSDAYIEEVARNDLGMVLPGDELWVVVDSPPPLTTTLAVDVTTVAPPFWQAWLDQLGW